MKFYFQYLGTKNKIVAVVENLRSYQMVLDNSLERVNKYLNLCLLNE